MCCKGRVVTAAVLHVENEGKIEDLRLQRECTSDPVGASEEYFLQSKASSTGCGYINFFFLDIMVVRLIAIDGQHQGKQKSG